MVMGQLMLIAVSIGPEASNVTVRLLLLPLKDTPVVSRATRNGASVCHTISLVIANRHNAHLTSPWHFRYVVFSFFLGVGSCDMMR